MYLWFTPVNMTAGLMTAGLLVVVMMVVVGGLSRCLAPLQRWLMLWLLCGCVAH
jgi:hypothetical protein